MDDYGYGEDYDPYSFDEAAWGRSAGKDEHLNYDADAGNLLTQEQRDLFQAAFEHMSGKSSFVQHTVLQQYLHHLQQQRPDGHYEYMFSERQAIRMMPSLRDAKKGMNFEQFMNVMYRVHKETEWSADRIIEAFFNSEGHYAYHPGDSTATNNKSKNKNKNKNNSGSATNPQSQSRSSCSLS